MLAHGHRHGPVARPHLTARPAVRADSAHIGYAVGLRARRALRSAPRSHTVSTPIHTYALTGPRTMREGLVRSLSPYVLRYPWAVARASPRRRPAGLHRTHPRPDQGDPARPRRSRRPRRRPDRHRQDGRLRAADAPAPPRVATDQRPARHPRADPHPDPRARAPGRGERPDLRRPEPDQVHDHLRRRRLRPAGPRAARRSRDRRRDAGPPARPPRPAHHRPVAGRDPRPRRGRPDARHGLHPRHPQGPRGPAAAPPEPALLGDLLRRDPAPRRRPARQPGLGPGHAAQHRRPSS